MYVSKHKSEPFKIEERKRKKKNGSKMTILITDQMAQKAGSVAVYIFLGGLFFPLLSLLNCLAWLMGNLGLNPELILDGTCHD